jgi:ethanolamine permease
MSTHPVPGAAPALKQTLTTLQLWGIAVGLVISGEYFGWSYGWASAGTLGFTVTALFIAAMYTSSFPRSTRNWRRWAPTPCS